MARETVRVDGIELTRSQVTEAYRKLNELEVIELSTKHFGEISVGLSDGKKIEMRNENGSRSGKGIYLGKVKGHKWVVRNGSYQSSPKIEESWQVLVLEPRE